MAVHVAQDHDPLPERGGLRALVRWNRQPGDVGQRLPGRWQHGGAERRGADDVTQDGAGLDRGQLLGVADE